MKDNILLSVVIPAYLEEENLRVILPRVKKVLEDLNIKYEILVIDAMEKMDDMEKVCKENNTYYINRENGNYYGDAVRTGIKYIKGFYAIFMDADGSHSPEFIKRLCNSKEGYDVVIASRYIKGGTTENNKLLIFMSLIVNMVYSRFLSLNCCDASISFKLYKSSLLKDLHLVTKNFDIIEEILVKLKKANKNLKIKEIPYAFKKRIFGISKRNLLCFAVSYIFSLFRLKFIGGKHFKKAAGKEV